MRIIFRSTSSFLQSLRTQLAQPHSFAAERVGFISVKATRAHDYLVLLAQDFFPVNDADYIDDPRVGALMGQDAIRKALNISLLQQVGMIHVHMHEHYGQPRFSKTDLREQKKFVPDFFKVRRELPHGAIVLSHDKAIGRVWTTPDSVFQISEFNTMGAHTTIDTSQASRRLDFMA